MDFLFYNLPLPYVFALFAIMLICVGVNHAAYDEYRRLGGIFSFTALLLEIAIFIVLLIQAKGILVSFI